ncbi:baseplate J/gp47 family protein [Fulvivirga ulvae]|uniref:baseplate J/gp47 family protein n=1 Tax=Fulvivirga ulvae TaxID=2904245 RepID=UPI001F3AF708|nr:baseplate J/gp47 family protein [Fulvivirga ulvae]UII31367.1 baseplate J/gp47 family protein [Fulvivirga ulvae]
MTDNLTPQKLLLRDGTSQQDRNNPLLDPAHVKVDDRSLEQLIVEAQRLAQELRFFDEQNQLTATWELFLIDDAIQYKAASPKGKELQRAQWASQLAAFVEDPDSFASDEKLMSRLSRPHSVLFITFLKLLHHVKEQLNGLTRKHLDFYFKERLALTPREAVPDVVNVLLGLAEDVDKLEVKKGTTLLAGEDEDGNPLHYAVDEDTIISRARIAQLKNVFVDKRLLAIQDIHRENADTLDRGLTRMLEAALGHPAPGDPLPILPEGVEDLIALDTLVEQDNVAAKNYVTGQLFLSVEDFKLIFQKSREESQDIPTNWQPVYDALDNAFKAKIRKRRQDKLKAIRENEGFEAMVKHVYGSPKPGDNLPLYRGGLTSFASVHKDLLNDNPAISQEATDYIFEELKLDKQHFDHIARTGEEANAKEEDWNKVYRLLELADRETRGFILPSPVREELSDIYAASDAKAHAFNEYGDDDESKRFKTFGSRQQGVALDLKPANIGLAISTPTLLLTEGRRQITVLMDFALQSDNADPISSLFSLGVERPFQIHLSSEEQWFIPPNTTFEFGDYIGREYEGTYQGQFEAISDTASDEVAGNITDKKKYIKSEGQDFSPLDIGKYLVDLNGLIYQVTTVVSQEEVEVSKAGDLELSADEFLQAVRKYSPQQVYLKGLKVVINLRESDVPVVPFKAKDQVQYVDAAYPALALSLNHFLADEIGKERYMSHYHSLMDLKLNKIQLSVDVKNVKDITLQNDEGVISAKKPFEPFGTEPETGNSFYFTNKEISLKKLESLDLQMQWVKAPEDFSAYYQNYWHILKDEPVKDKDEDQGETPDFYTIKGNTDFKAEVFFHNANEDVKVGNITLFADELLDDPREPHDVHMRLAHNFPETYTYRQDPNVEMGAEEVLDWSRYFKLELSPLDFQHSIFNTLFVRQAMSDKPEIKTLIINPPYQPKLKSLHLNYSAYTDIIPDKAGAKDHDALYHMHPFGFKQLLEQENAALLPLYRNEGELFLGIADLDAPQILSVLFQMAEGSADPDVEKTVLQWSYLRNNEWVGLPSSAIISDTTNGLINTGIVRIKVPADATTGGTLMPDALHWLKIDVDKNIVGVSDTVDILAQAISATLSSETVAPSHFATPLKAETITETKKTFSEIVSVTQPFTSSKGKPAEQGNDLYKRISERLRHKNRALTMWDYEHMVLDRFPQVFKVKCLPAKEEPGRVDVVVIPDIKGTQPFNPFAPKVAADTLFEIRKHLDTHSPAHAEVVVQNPFYLQVLTRCSVKFYPGYDEEFYKAKLIEEIKRFLSPWAYNDQGDIRIGGSLNASVLINFIAERPYIDYVAHLKLFQSEDGKTFVDVRAINDGKAAVIPSRSDMVMVSAPSHEIDVLSESAFNEDSFEGINYMKVQLDFKVGEDIR